MVIVVVMVVVVPILIEVVGLVITKTKHRNEWGDCFGEGCRTRLNVVLVIVVSATTLIVVVAIEVMGVVGVLVVVNTFITIHFR